MWRLAVGAVLVLAGALAVMRLEAASPPMPTASLTEILTALVQQEDSATLSGHHQALAAVFGPQAAGAPALRKAEHRMAYIREWAAARAVHFQRVVVSVRITRVVWRGPTVVRIDAADRARYVYRQAGAPSSAWFGLGVYHRYTLRQQDGRWFIAADDFIDPLNQDTRLPGAAHPDSLRVPAAGRWRTRSPGADRALAYASTYCGAAPGCGNDGRYNPRFADYNWNGGDCTNFISQVLWAGGFAQTAAWHWKVGQHDGTVDWVNAHALVRYLEATGRATVLSQGSLSELVSPHGGEPAPVTRLRPGDVVGYVEHGRVAHLAVVAGDNGAGYPVVMSHSADRYREPWDLGWDHTTRYLLLQIHYPAATASPMDVRPATEAADGSTSRPAPTPPTGRPTAAGEETGREL